MEVERGGRREERWREERWREERWREERWREVGVNECRGWAWRCAGGEVGG
jgi:hypothetical protein